MQGMQNNSSSVNKAKDTFISDIAFVASCFYSCIERMHKYRLA